MFLASPVIARRDPYTVLSLRISPTFVPYGFLEQKTIWAVCARTALLVYKEQKTLFKEPLKGDDNAKQFLP